MGNLAIRMNRILFKELKMNSFLGLSPKVVIYKQTFGHFTWSLNISARFLDFIHDLYFGHIIFLHEINSGLLSKIFSQYCHVSLKVIIWWEFTSFLILGCHSRCSRWLGSLLQMDNRQIGQKISKPKVQMRWRQWRILGENEIKILHGLFENHRRW